MFVIIETFWETIMLMDLVLKFLAHHLLSKVSQMTNSLSDREHVTKYILNNLDKFNVHAIKPPVSLSYPDLKFDVDYPSDLKT